MACDNAHVLKLKHMPRK